MATLTKDAKGLDMTEFGLLKLKRGMGIYRWDSDPFKAIKLWIRYLTMEKIQMSYNSICSR